MNQSLPVRIILAIPIIIIITLFFYPYEIPNSSITSKTLLAVMGLFIIGIRFFSNQGGIITKDLLELSVIAVFVSFFSALAMIVNGTPDTTYVTYIVSMWVWLSAAFAVISFIRLFYARVTVLLLCEFLIIASLVQCVSAIMIDQSVAVHDFVARYFNHTWTESVNRLYGITAELDTAGIHFSVVLVMISYVIGKYGETMSKARIVYYWLSFIAITVIGNMIARTTLVGVAFALLYLAYKSGIFMFRINADQKRALSLFCLVGVCSLPIIVYFYNTNEQIYENIRFGFEGFFSLAEKGKWEVASNNTLKSMVVFPESLKTWLIGDGYILNPRMDPYYTGTITPGFYMNTDIGYLRFVFYFGVLGLASFSYFIIRSGMICARRLPRSKALCYALVLLNFVIWLKVATDLFFIFALLYFLDETDEQRLSFE